MVRRQMTRQRRWLLAPVAGIGVSLLISACASNSVTTAKARAGSEPSCNPATSSATASSQPIPTTTAPEISESPSKGATTGPGAVSSPVTKANEPPDATQLAQVRQWVACAAVANGDTDPNYGGVAVLSTRQTAVKYLFDGETVDSDVPVIAVEVPGKFTNQAFDRPPQAARNPPTTGNMLIIVYNLAEGTGDTRLVGADEQPPDLAALGPTANF